MSCRLLEGSTLEDHLQKSLHCTEDFMLDIGAQLLDVSGAKWFQAGSRPVYAVSIDVVQTLEFMQARAGLVHGDISPRNIMLRKMGTAWGLKLFDLGASETFRPGRCRTA